LKTRVIVGLSLLTALSLACWVDILIDRAVVSSILIVVLGLAALREWNAFFRERGGTYAPLLYAAGLAYPILAGLRILLGWDFAALEPLFIVAVLATLYLWSILSGDVGQGLDRVARTFLGFMTIYLFYYLVPLLLLKDQGGGLGVAYGMVFTAKSCDIGAYLTGSFVGRRKLIPKVSPGKTVEGGIGGLVLATLTGMAAMQLAGRGAFPFGALFGLLIGLAAVCGDLIESLVKRCVGVKDSASLLPGQGGILDLIDSLLFAAPIGYVLLVLL